MKGTALLRADGHVTHYIPEFGFNQVKGDWDIRWFSGPLQSVQPNF